MIDLEELFEQYEDEYGQFSKEVNPLHKRPDLCAFLLLDKLVPGGDDIVSAAEHDQIWLDVDCEALAKAATADDVRTLARCGVMYDEDHECLSMWA